MRDFLVFAVDFNVLAAVNIDRCCSFCVHTMCSVLPTRDLYHNIVFSSCADAPSPPGNLQLNYRSENQLILQWERPANLHEGVDVTYLIQIANLTSGSVTQVNLGQYSMRGQYIEASVYTGGGNVWLVPGSSYYTYAYTSL